MNLVEALKIIGSTRVKKGDSPESACRSDRMNAIMDAIQALARGENVVSGINMRKRVSEGSFILSARTSGGLRGGGGADLPFAMTLVNQDPLTGDPVKFAVQILDGKVNNEWPDVGVTTMGASGGSGYGTLNINDVANSNIFIRVMFNGKTSAAVRLDIYERPNETFPTDKITFLPTDEDPVEGACDSVDNPDDPPPAGYGAIHILLGFTYVQPATPPATPTPIVFQSEIGNIKFELVYGTKNGLPAVITAKTYSSWVKVPLQATP